MSNKNNSVQSEFNSNWKEIVKATALSVVLGPAAGTAVYHSTKKKNAKR